MRQIPLSKKGTKHKGKYFALVDDKDFDWLNQYNWTVFLTQGKAYAYGYFDKDRIFMHRFIMNLKYEKIEVDHKDGCGLNNQRDNLRLATRSQNVANRKTRSGVSKYLGVHLGVIKTRHGKIYLYWRAEIKKGRKTVFFKQFNKEEEAAQAYNEAAKKYHGEFANLNFICEENNYKGSLYDCYKKHYKGNKKGIVMNGKIKQ